MNFRGKDSGHISNMRKLNLYVMKMRRSEGKM